MNNVITEDSLNGVRDMSLPTRDGYRLTVVPFSGFYESVHSQTFDDAEEQLSEGLEDETVGTLHERIFMGTTYSIAYTKYAKAYVEAFADMIGVPLEFESLQSPVFYNFETDRIFAWIADAGCAALTTRVLTDHRDILDTIAEAELTSRSGFASHYSPDVDDWGDWDHNLLGLALEALATDLHANGQRWSSYDELDIMGGHWSNGYIDAWLSEAMNDDARAAVDELADMRYRYDAS
jgi:hypothetical protein